MSEDQNAQENCKKEKLEDLLTHILEEARMVLPGIQALLGFQLVAVFNQKFSALDRADQCLHLVDIFLSVNAICFLLTPAALHRQSQPETITKSFTKTASRLVCVGMMPLLFSIVIDVYVVSDAVLKSTIGSLLIAVILFVELSICWLVWPQLERRKSSKRGREAVRKH